MPVSLVFLTGNESSRRQKPPQRMPQNKTASIVGRIEAVGESGLLLRLERADYQT